MYGSAIAVPAIPPAFPRRKERRRTPAPSPQQEPRRTCPAESTGKAPPPPSSPSHPPIWRRIRRRRAGLGARQAAPPWSSNAAPDRSQGGGRRISAAAQPPRECRGSARAGRDARALTLARPSPPLPRHRHRFERAALDRPERDGPCTGRRPAPAATPPHPSHRFARAALTGGDRALAFLPGDDRRSREERGADPLERDGLRPSGGHATLDRAATLSPRSSRRGKGVPSSNGLGASWGGVTRIAAYSTCECTVRALPQWSPT